MIYLHFVCVYVGTEYLHFRYGLCAVVLVFRVGCLCVVGWLCRVLKLYNLYIIIVLYTPIFLFMG